MQFLVQDNSYFQSKLSIDIPKRSIVVFQFLMKNMEMFDVDLLLMKNNLVFYDLKKFQIYDKESIIFEPIFETFESSVKSEAESVPESQPQNNEIKMDDNETGKNDDETRKNDADIDILIMNLTKMVIFIFTLSLLVIGIWTCCGNQDIKSFN